MKKKTKLQYFVEKYLVPNKSNAPREMRKRWGWSDNHEIYVNYPIYQWENDKPNAKITHKWMNASTLFEIIQHDPTSVIKENGTGIKDIQKIGGYTQWIINQYFKLFPEDFSGYKDKRWLQQREAVRVFFEDLFRVKEDLQKFNRFKHRLPKDKHDIGRVKNNDELYELTKNFSLEEALMTKTEVKQQIMKSDAKLVYEDDNYQIIIPLSPAASYELAGPPLTRWCTASSNNSNMHTHYSKDGPLYIIRNKKDIVGSGKGAGEPRPIFQFHFQSSQYMDADDRRIPDLVEYLNHPKHKGFKEYFKPNFLDAFNRREFDPNDITFKNYVSLYGANEEMNQTILKFLKKKVESSDEIVVQDENKDYSGYIEMLKYEEFLKYVIQYAKPSTRVFEIIFKKYSGKGLVVPRELSKLTSVTNMVLSGFVKTIPNEISQLKHLELVAFADNPHMKYIPEEFAEITTLRVVNVMRCGTPTLTHKDLPTKLQQAENEGKVLFVFS